MPSTSCYVYKQAYLQVCFGYAELHSMEGVQQSVFVQSKYTVEVRKCRAVYQGPACWQECVVSLIESGV